MGAAIGTAGPDYRESAAAEVFRKLAAVEPPLGRVRAGGGSGRPGEGLVLQRCEYISHAAVLRDARAGVQVRDTECSRCERCEAQPMRSASETMIPSGPRT